MTSVFCDTACCGGARAPQVRSFLKNGMTADALVSWLRGTMKESAEGAVCLTIAMLASTPAVHADAPLTRAGQTFADAAAQLLHASITWRCQEYLQATAAVLQAHGAVLAAFQAALARTLPVRSADTAQPSEPRPHVRVLERALRDSAPHLGTRE